MPGKKTKGKKQAKKTPARARKGRPASSRPAPEEPSSKSRTRKLAECGFIVDDRFLVHEFIGDTAELLDFTPGDATLDLRRLLRPDLRPDLVRAIEMSRSQKTPVRSPGPRIWIGGRLATVQFEIVPLPKHDGLRKVLVRHSAWDRGRPRVPAEDRPDRQEEFRRLREGLHSFLEEEDRRHTALLTDLQASRAETAHRQADLETAYAQLEEANAELEGTNVELEETNSHLRASIEERERVEQQLRESEAAARELIETAAEGVLAVNGAESIVMVNQLACSMFGYRPDELVGRKLSALIPRGLKKAHTGHTASFFEHPARRRMGSGRDLLACRKDGSVFPVEIGLSSFDRSGERLAVAFIADISQRKQLEAESMRQREQLRSLTQRLAAAAEEESRRWARELHDVFSQRLVGIGMEVGALAAEEDHPAPLEAVGAEIRRLAEDVHALSRSMHPSVLHDLGLEAAIKAELAMFERQHGTRTRLQSRNVPSKMAGEVALCLYRILQEALQNIRKHSRARNVEVAIQGSADAVTMTVEDLGNGFDLARARGGGGLGLVSMEERARAVDGEFSIESTPGVGTTIRVRVPLAGGREIST